MNPYMAGTLLGIVLLASMYVSGRGLGASGGIKYFVVSIVGAIDRQHAENSVYYSKYFEENKKPMTNWLVLEIFGIVAGGFISGAVSGRLKLKIEKSPKISSRGGCFLHLPEESYLYTEDSWREDVQAVPHYRAWRYSPLPDSSP